MIKLIFGIWKNLSSKRKYQFFFLIVISILSAISEFITLGTLSPLLVKLSAGESREINTNTIINLFQHLNLNSSSSIALLFATSVVITAAFRLINVWLNCKTACNIGHDLSMLCYEKSLCRPYISHINENSSSTIVTTTTQVDFTVEWLFQVLQIITGAFTSLFIIPYFAMASASSTCSTMTSPKPSYV